MSLKSLTTEEKILITYDVLVGLGWKFYQRDGLWYSSVPRPDGTHSECPEGYEEQNDAIKIASAMMLTVIGQDPMALGAFMLRMKDRAERLREEKRMEERLENPAEPGSHAWLKGLLTKYGNQPQA